MTNKTITINREDLSHFSSFLRKNKLCYYSKNDDTKFTFDNGNTYKIYCSSIYINKGADTYLDWDVGKCTDKVLENIVAMINILTGLNLVYKR